MNDKITFWGQVAAMVLGVLVHHGLPLAKHVVPSTQGSAAANNIAQAAGTAKPLAKHVVPSTQGSAAANNIAQAAGTAKPLANTAGCTNHITLAWTGVPSAAYEVDYRTNPASVWAVAGYVTNSASMTNQTFARTTTNPMEFYRVGAFWP